jgi:hypothetical protein
MDTKRNLVAVSAILATLAVSAGASAQSVVSPPPYSALQMAAAATPDQLAQIRDRDHQGNPFAAATEQSDHVAQAGQLNDPDRRDPHSDRFADKDSNFWVADKDSNFWVAERDPANARFAQANSDRRDPHDAHFA